MKTTARAWRSDQRGCSGYWRDVEAALPWVCLLVAVYFGGLAAVRWQAEQHRQEIAESRAS